MTTRADTSTSTRQEIETRLDAFYAAWQARDGVGMRALFGGGDRLLVWAPRATSASRAAPRQTASSTGGWTPAHPGPLSR